MACTCAELAETTSALVPSGATMMPSGKSAPGIASGTAVEAAENGAVKMPTLLELRRSVTSNWLPSGVIAIEPPPLLYGITKATEV